jgi:hypothetical protein
VRPSRGEGRPARPGVGAPAHEGERGSPGRAKAPRPEAKASILWLAVAEARGHLMRAHLARGLLAEQGVLVDVVTTSDEGAAFLAELGTPCEVLSRRHRLVYDEQQNLDRLRTEARVARYLLGPAGCLRDLRWLEARAEGAAFVVNDSLHPALVVAPGLPRFGAMRVVQLHGEHVLGATLGHFDGRVPRRLAGRYAAAVRSALGRSFAEVELSLDAPLTNERDDRRLRLPPLPPLPSRTRAEVRAALGVDPRRTLAVVYLNPHFKDPALAEAIEAELQARGHVVRAVGEGYAERPGWVARDPALVDAVAAADVLVSAPGLGALAQARLFGTPLLTIVTDQPEQRENLRWLEGERRGHPWASVSLATDLPTLRPRLAAALADLAGQPARARPCPTARAAALRARWSDALLGLVVRARREAPLPLGLAS